MACDHSLAEAQTYHDGARTRAVCVLDSLSGWQRRDLGSFMHQQQILIGFNDLGLASLRRVVEGAIQGCRCAWLCPADVHGMGKNDPDKDAHAPLGPVFLRVACIHISPKTNKARRTSNCEARLSGQMAWLSCMVPYPVT